MRESMARARDDLASEAANPLTDLWGHFSLSISGAVTIVIEDESGNSCLAIGRVIQPHRGLVNVLSVRRGATAIPNELPIEGPSCSCHPCSHEGIENKMRDDPIPEGVVQSVKPPENLKC
jgi:hypothetical protein